jgi:hypothetical protein
MEETKIEELKQKLELQRRDVLQFLTRLQCETQSLDADSTQGSRSMCHQHFKGMFVPAEQSEKNTAASNRSGAPANR